MRRTLIALAAATTLAVPLITLLAVPAASASTSDPYCYQNTYYGLYIGSAPKDDQVPMNSTCRVEFTRINYEDIGTVGYYEYKNDSGPDVGLCLKEDPGITVSPYGHPVVDYPCNDSGGTTQAEEEWADPPIPLNANDGYTLATAAGKLWSASGDYSGTWQLCAGGPCSASSSLRLDR
jgi:hypothetical protein